MRTDKERLMASWHKSRNNNMLNLLLADLAEEEGDLNKAEAHRMLARGEAKIFRDLREPKGSKVAWDCIRKNPAKDFMDDNGWSSFPCVAVHGPTHRYWRKLIAFGPCYRISGPTPTAVLQDLIKHVARVQSVLT